MVRVAITAVLASLAWPAAAAPFLVADPYPPSGVQPDAAFLSVSGGPVSVPNIGCTLQNVAGGVQPRCDLGGLAASGKYTLVMTVSKAGGLAGDAGGASYSAGGQASSAPFVYSVQGGTLNAPSGLRILP